MPPLFTQPLWRRFLVFLAPLVLTNVLQAFGGTMVTIYLGQLLGTRSLAAAVSFFPLFMCCISFVIGLGAGASVLVGQAWGARDTDKVRRVAGTIVLGTLALACVVAGIGVLAIGHVLQAMGTPAEVVADATAYARVLLLAMPFLFLHLISAAILRGLGDSITPLKALVVASSIWVLLTPAFILGWLGLPRLGTESAAWSSMAGNAAAVGWIAWSLHRKGHLLAPRALWPHLRLDMPLLKMVVRLGIPTGLFFVTSSFADVLLLSLVNGHGAEATAAWGAVTQVIAYVQFPAMSIAIAASVFAAQAIGAGQLHEVDHVTRVGLWMNVLLTGGLAAVVALGAPMAVALFTKDAAVIELATGALRIVAWGGVAFGLASVFTSVMRAAGTVRTPTIISLGCIGLLMFPLAWAFQQAAGVKGVWAAYPVTYVCALVLQGLYFFGVWKKKPIRRMV
ncbi:MAG: MATE family efflux transporter [Ramlibacter sp.]